MPGHLCCCEQQTTVLAVRQPISYGAGGASDVDERDGSFQLVVAGLVEEVAETDQARGFPDNVRYQVRRGMPEHSNHGFHLLTATLQIGASHGEVGAIQNASSDE